MTSLIDSIIEKLQEEPRKTFKELREQRYPITTLIGSSKWPDDFKKWLGIWGLMGHQVWSICIAGHSITNFDMCGNAKRQLDAAYMAKIEQSDQVFVINDHQYIGLGTQDELLYALSLGKQIGFAAQFKNSCNTQAIVELARHEGYIDPEIEVVALPSCYIPPVYYYQLNFTRFES